MAELSSFPNDDNLWFVKWIDNFGFIGDAHAAAVCVLLQKLPFTSPEVLNDLTQGETEKILGTVAKGSDLFFTAKISVGTLPNVAIGTVFQNGSFIGELPLHRRVILLKNPLAKSVKLSDDVTAPETWRSPAKYRWLNLYEYSGLFSDYSESRCLLHQTEDIDYLIPHTTILKYFYAPHTSLANAIIGGPWEMRKSHVIQFGEMESGYRTFLGANPTIWNIIIKNLSKNFAFHAALYNFDPYAHACANLIHSEAQRSAKRTGGNIGLLEWFCNALIPFRACSRPLELGVKGFVIGPSKSIPKQKYLVTSIVECSVPDYIPSISAALFNSNDKGETIIETDEDPPFAGAKKEIQPGQNMVIDEQRDSIEDMKPITLYTEEHEWLDLPKIDWQKKKQSKSYPKPIPLPSVTANNQNVSTGVPGSPSTSLPPLHAQNPARRASHRFKLIIQALNKLSREKPLSYSIVQPYNPMVVTNRNGFVCWKFISEDVRLKIKSADDGWRVIRSKSDDDSALPPVPRAALVLKIIYKSQIGYWIEIENNPQEPGARSPFIFNTNGKITEIMPSILDAIAVLKGVSLFSNLQKEISLRTDAKVESYRHQYERNSDTRILSTKSILIHLDKCLDPDQHLEHLAH
jgi:hypothetical protein